MYRTQGNGQPVACSNARTRFNQLLFHNSFRAVLQAPPVRRVWGFSFFPWTSVMCVMLVKDPVLFENAEKLALEAQLSPDF